MPSKRPIFNLRLRSKAQHAEIKKAAKSDQRSTNEFIVQCIERCLAMSAEAESIRHANKSAMDEYIKKQSSAAD